jgi:crotonobetainyl-CoA:carnitine CoA-transferase CaiB-like acyl-CoA transferase
MARDGGFEAAGHDINYIAMTGALAAIGPEDFPVPPLNLAGDYGGGPLCLVTGILAAIISAARTGEGQVVDAAICDGAASLMAMFTELAGQGGWSDRRAGNLLDGGKPTSSVSLQGRPPCRSRPARAAILRGVLKLAGLSDDPTSPSATTRS